MRLSALLALASKVTLPPHYRYGMSRPGSLADKRKNPPGTRRRPVAVEPISDEDWHLFCGDRVEILEGKDAGKQGKVVQIIRQRNWVVVEGLNTHFRYIRQTKDDRGTMVPSEAPLLHNQVKLVDPVDRQAHGTLATGHPESTGVNHAVQGERRVGCSGNWEGGAISRTCAYSNPNTEEQRNKMGTSVFAAIEFWVGGRQGDRLAPRPGSPFLSTRKSTEVEWRFNEAGERVRVSTRSGRIIPKPEFPRADGIIPETWIDGPKDTSVEDALERTYVPRLKTLEEEVMEAMGIQETRRHRKVYWY